MPTDSLFSLYHAIHDEPRETDWLECGDRGSLRLAKSYLLGSVCTCLLFLFVLAIVVLLQWTTHAYGLPASPDRTELSSTHLSTEASYGTSILIQTAQGTPEGTIHGRHELWERKPDVQWTADFPTSSMPVIDVTSTDTDQELVGFGGAFTETSATVFYQLPLAIRNHVLDMYFSLDGLGYTMGRTHINSCDFSLGSYSFDDVQEDLNLEYFDTKVQHDIKSGLVDFIREAQDKIAEHGRTLHLLASPWSPPAWMKTNGQMVGDGNNNHTDTIFPQYYDVWARYIAKWVSSYNALGIAIWGVTAQNEPLQNQVWESNYFTIEQEARFVGSSLGPVLKSTYPEMLIFIYDMFLPKVDEWADYMYSHPTASQYVSGVGWHWYSGDLFSLVGNIHENHPTALLLPTELTYEQVKWKPGTRVEDGDWAFGEGYGHDIIGNLNAGAIGWLDWNLILDPTGGPNHVGNVCDSAIMANVTTQRLFIHPQYYFIGHFSKYILPGSKRVRSTLAGTVGPVTLQESLRRGYGVCKAEDGLQATVWQRPDKQIVAVILNCADSAIDFKMKDGSRSFKGMIPAHGIQTYMFTRN